MKTIKPLRLGVLTRVYEIGTTPWLVVTSFAYFPLSRPDVLLGEQSMWLAFAKEAGEVEISIDGSTPPHVAPGILDEGLPKATGEVLVRGYAMPTGGPQVGCSVKVRVGPAEAPLVDKSLVVTGDRHWEFLGMTMPEPFEKMPLDWAHAFGGEGYPDNPVGKGFGTVPGPDGKPVQLLPNVEYPKERIKAKGDRPRPACLGPMDPGWPARLSKLGTFDKRWLDTEYPGMPSDLDLEAFNSAPADQRIRGHFRGGEPFAIEGMHPTRQLIEGTLPEFRARSFILGRGQTEADLREVPMRLETVQLWPHLERGVLIYRGITKIEEDDGHDVSHLMIAAERPDAPRDLDHYRAIFRVRTDPEKGAQSALRDSDLLPEMPSWKEPGDPLDEMLELTRRQSLIEKNLDKKTARDHHKMVEEIRAAGLDPVDFDIPPEAPKPLATEPVELEDIPAVAEAAEKEAADEEVKARARLADAEARGRAACAENGIDYDELMKRQSGGGPPKFSADAELQTMRHAVATANDVGVQLPGIEAKAHDPEFEAQLRQQEQQLKDLYRESAHFMPAAHVPDAPERHMIGQRVLAAHGGGVSLVDVDHTGADLAGADLRAADLSLSFLEGANLEGADLAGANLTRAVLARADLRGANLAGADLTHANLGEADLAGADLRGANLTGAIIFRSKLHGVDMARANLTEVDAWEVELKDVNLEDATLSKTTFARVLLERVNAVGAHIDEVSFVESQVPELDLSRAQVRELSFVATKGPDCVFREAQLEGFSLLGECSFPRADFSGAKMPGAALRGTDLEGANFSGADLTGADLSECNARGANFHRAIATEIMLIRTDLTDADLRESKLLDAIAQKAKLAGANFDGANLFQADLAAAKGDDRTRFSNTNLGRVRQTRRES